MRVPTVSEYRGYDGAHCSNLWRSLPEDWRCPACRRTKHQIMRWTTRYADKDRTTGKYRRSSKGWMAGLHGHHDHGGPGFYGTDAGARFAETVICDQCNAADGRAKRALGLPATFSFSPSEIGRFVSAAPHAKHTLDLERAEAIYLEVCGGSGASPEDAG